MRIRYTIVMLILTVAALPALAQKDLPYGWHKLSEAEMGWREPVRVFVHADFDGDGKMDTAIILADDRGGAEGLFAFLTSTSRWVKLDSDKVEGFKDKGLLVRRPGVVKTDCARRKNEDGCKDGQPEEVSLSRPGIVLLTKADEDFVFYWDRESKTFKRAPLAVNIDF